MTRLKTAMLISVVLFATCFTAQASDFWDKLSGKEIRPHTIIVTSNYVKSRMLAELIQFKTGQPVLLLPTGEEKNLFALGAKGESRTLTKAQYLDWIDLVHPSAIVFIGGNSKVEADYYDALKKRYSCAKFEHEDMSKVAQSVESVMRLGGLAENYEKLLKKIDPEGRPVPALDPTKIWDHIPQGDNVSTKEGSKK